MERDFLCAMGRKGDVGKEESRAEPDCSGGGPPAMQWQFPAKSGAAPAFMSFRTAREESSKEFSISGFRPPASTDAFDSIKKHTSSPVTPPQRQFGFDTPVATQQYGHRAQGLDHGASAHHLLGGSRMVQPLSARHPVPFNQANPSILRTQSFNNASNGLFKNQHFAMSNGFGGSTVGAYGARNPRSQNSTQMTIFYNGTVNVFDNVSVEKAQELMLLASKASISSPPSVVRKPDSPISAPAVVRKPDSPISAPAIVRKPDSSISSASAKVNMPEILPARQIVTQKPEPSVAHLATTSSPISIVPQSVALPRSASNCTTDSTGPKTAVQPPVTVPISQASSSQPMPLATTCAAAVMTRAVPQARKASLARFLERRKERVTSVEPYPTSKSPLESSDNKGSAGALSKSSFDIAPRSNNGGEPLRFGQPRNISFSSEVSPSTRLQI
ncbi:hypothetical protein EJB05_48974 [Eragrostis curvula]|uniref:Protein TIFY n=1 Tax=Eragrostis curvula TaxID=38414 RepID=A0A5J9T5M1_9POAL|nr:hypothetical protein EJB05_48974 [Eragrostis curvula]